MGRISKVFLWLFIALAGLFAVAAVAFLLLFEPDDFRDEIAAAVYEATGRELAIAGEVSLDIFPWLAIEVGEASLGNAPGFGDEAFAAFDHARLSVRLLPLLLRREVAVGTAELDGLRLNLVVDPQGRSNWADLVAEDEAAAPEATHEEAADGEDARFNVSSIAITNAGVRYDDRQAGTVYTLTEAQLAIGPVRDAVATDVLTVDGLEFTGMVEGVAEQPGRVRVATKGIEMRRREQALVVAPVTIHAFGLDIDVAFEPVALGGDAAPQASVRVNPFSPRSLMTVFGVEPPVTADPGAFSELSVEAYATLGETALALTDVSLRLDGTTFTGTLELPFGDGTLAFDFTGDRFDVDRYMAPAGEAGSEAEGEEAPLEIPVELIRALEARGKLRVANVGAGGLLLENAELGLRAAAGRVRLHPFNADLYGGRYRGDISVDASGNVPQLSVNENIEGVDLARLAQALFEQDNISGTIQGSFRLAGRGQDLGAIRRSLAGNMALQLTDGTYEGTDIWYELRRARALLRKETAPEPVLPARTRFSSVSATGVVAGGVMRNEDFVAELPFIQLSGQGSVDLAAGTVDYGLRARVLEKPELMRGVTPEELEDFTKVVVPVRVTGPLASPKVKPDVESLLRQRVEEEVREKLKKKLRDIFDQ